MMNCYPNPISQQLKMTPGTTPEPYSQIPLPDLYSIIQREPEIFRPHITKPRGRNNLSLNRSHDTLHSFRLRGRVSSGILEFKQQGSCHLQYLNYNHKLCRSIADRFVCLHKSQKFIHSNKILHVERRKHLQVHNLSNPKV